MGQLVEVVVADGIARVTLNRPDKRNAFDRPMWEAVTAAFTGLDEAAGCVLLTAAGPAFSSGADIAEFFECRRNAVEAAAYGEVMEAAYRAIRECPAPVVVAIAGACTGAGLVVALAADLRIAAADARFGIPVSRLGLAMPLPELAIVVPAIGRARTLDLLLSARLMDATEAADWGLVTRVVDTPALIEEATDLARDIAAGPRAVNTLHKQMVTRVPLDGRGPLNRGDRMASYAPFDEPDYREGISAFLEKRSPRFVGS